MLAIQLTAKAATLFAFLYVFALMAFWPEPARLVLAAVKAVVS